MKWLYVTLLVLLVVSVLLRFVKRKYALKDASLTTNGFQVLKCFNEDDVQYLKNNWNDNGVVKSFIQSPRILKQMQDVLGPSYVFQDYVLMIEKSRIHTCHRDVNSKQFNKKQKYPSYTVIFYLEPMKRCLDVIDKSHETTDGIFFTDETESVQCVPGDAILFDAGLIHSGSKNDKPDNKRIQMKLTHVDDIETLSFFENYNKAITEDNKNSDITNDIQKHVSCQFPIVGDMFKSAASKPVEQFFTSLFYGNPKFYELKTL